VIYYLGCDSTGFPLRWWWRALLAVYSCSWWRIVIKGLQHLSLSNLFFETAHALKLFCHWRPNYVAYNAFSWLKESQHVADILKQKKILVCTIRPDFWMREDDPWSITQRVFGYYPKERMDVTAQMFAAVIKHTKAQPLVMCAKDDWENLMALLAEFSVCAHLWSWSLWMLLRPWNGGFAAGLTAVVCYYVSLSLIFEWSQMWSVHVETFSPPLWWLRVKWSIVRMKTGPWQHVVTTQLSLTAWKYLNCWK